jgi:hypothetical protein
MSIQTNNKTKTRNNLVSKVALAMMIGSGQHLSADWRSENAVKCVVASGLGGVILGALGLGLFSKFVKGNNVFYKNTNKAK